MESSLEVAQSLLKIGAAALFSSQPPALDQIEFDLSMRDFQGLAVTSVSEVDLRQRDTLPLLLASQVTAVRDWETPIADNLTLLMFDHVTGTVTAVRPFDDDRPGRREPEPSTARAPKPTGDAALSTGTSVRRVDARKLFQMPWAPGRLSFHAMSFDWLSNSADVSLVDGSTTRAAKTRQVMPEPGADGKGLPSYELLSDLPVPAQPGVAFEVKPGLGPSQAVVRGSLVTTALMRHIPSGSQTVAGKPVAAVVPVTLVVTGRGWKVPWLLEWGIPVLGPRLASVGSSVTGHFSITLRDPRARTLTPGEYVAYVVMEGRVYGPRTFTMPATVR